jgi:hypothetical protein
MQRFCLINLKIGGCQPFVQPSCLFWRISGRWEELAPSAKIWSEEVEMKEKARTEISTELLEELRRVAREQGRSETDVLEEAVRYYFRLALDRALSDPDLLKPNLSELFERVDREQRERGVEPLSEEEAMRLAVEEQHAWRRERSN